MKETWDNHLNDEIAYWESMIAETFHNKEWVDGFKVRCQGKNIFPQHLRKYLKDINSTKILDVGSGPATVLGGSIDDICLNITAIDPLADEYNLLFSKYARKNFITPLNCEAELLHKIFKPRSFDFVYSRNALDHSHNPILAIQSMINACTHNGIVFFENVINEGVNEGFKGLHQWNFMPASGDLVIWDEQGKGELLSKNISEKHTLNVFTVRPRWIAVEIKVS